MQISIFAYIISPPPQKKNTISTLNIIIHQEVGSLSVSEASGWKNDKNCMYSFSH